MLIVDVNLKKNHAYKFNCMRYIKRYLNNLAMQIKQFLLYMTLNMNQSLQ